MYDCPYAHFEVEATFLVWRPQTGVKLRAQISLQSASHLGLLIDGIFNASIPASHINKALYKWTSESNYDENHGEQTGTGLQRRLDSLLAMLSASLCLK